jgi:hypothetical protein
VITYLEATDITERNLKVVWRSDASEEVRVSLRRGGEIIRGPIRVPTVGRPELVSSHQLRFDDLEPGTTYEIVIEGSGPARTRTVTTRRSL